MRPAARRRWPAVLAALALLTTGCEFDGAYDLPLPGSPVEADHSYEITAEFRDILNVVPRSPVMVDDVTVGEVTEVDRVGWHAQVTLRIRDDVELPDNAIADIRQVSLLGEKYVALESPADGASANPLGEGDHLRLESTGRNPEVEEVLGALSFLLSGGGVAQLGTITEELNHVMGGRTERMRHLLGSLESVVGTLDEQKGDIISALESLNNLTATLNRERRTITGALDVAGPAIKVLGDQHDELVAMLRSLDRLGVVGTRVITASKDDIIASLRHLQPVVKRLRQAGDKLAPGLNLLVSFPFPQEASEIVLGDYANTSIRADINLANFFSAGGGGPLPDLPDLPLPGLPPDLANQVLDCLASGSLSSKACVKVLANLTLLAELVERCTRATNADNPVCVALAGLQDGEIELPDLGLPGGLSGLGRGGLSRLSRSLTDATPSTAPSAESLYGGETG
ncbi:MCE family protein [Nocardioides sp. cx-169]|uniref:MCE family protein n=1 Tax=Nocardioides sp. cx-169 TaxID=2899080 RepID=UPI0027E1DA06|nr:MCE family protein [Nocardioides sp. cx-169]